VVVFAGRAGPLHVACQAAKVAPILCSQNEEEGPTLQQPVLPASQLLPLDNQLNRLQTDRHAPPMMKNPRLPIEKRSDWTFERTGDDSWIWRVTRADGSKMSSQCTFSTVKACIADATRNGYVAWIPEAERRRTYGAEHRTALL
jgi:hypothetical protein